MGRQRNIAGDGANGDGGASGRPDLALTGSQAPKTRANTGRRFLHSLDPKLPFTGNVREQQKIQIDLPSHSNAE
jgi:hypothetical protein